MKKIPLSVLSIAVANGRIYVLVKENERLILKVLDEKLKVVDEVISVRGDKGFILYVKKDKALISVDENLLLVRGGETEAVLRASKPTNTFWHSTEAKGKVFIHEYGEPPTGIFTSKNLEDWEKVTTNLDIDRSSKHFHYIAYDPYRRWLLVTLGDGCLTRVAISEHLGSSWRPLYKGPWQFVPIVPLEDRIVFGMDSGIVRGGIGIYNVSENRWEFVFLRWIEKRVRYAQMTDLRFFKGLWIAALGTPQAVLVSSDLKFWHPIVIEGYDKNYNRSVSLDANGMHIVICNGKRVLKLSERELKQILNSTELMLIPYNLTASERLKALIFRIKRLM